MKNTDLPAQESILVAQDGSPNAQNAAITAIQIAKALHYQVQGIYVVDETLIMEEDSDFHRETDSVPAGLTRYEKEGLLEKQGHRVLQWLESRCVEANVTVSAAISQGGIPETLINLMEHSRLMAIGLRGHGHSTLDNYLGSNFKEVAHRAKIPFIAGGSEQRPLRKLLLAYNGKPHAINALTWARRLQEMLRVQVHVVTVKEEDAPAHSEARIKEVKQNLFQCNLGNCHFLSRKGRPAPEIAAAAKEVQADLLIMGGYRHKALLEWLVGSTVDEVLRKTVLTCLVV